MCWNDGESLGPIPPMQLLPVILSSFEAHFQVGESLGLE